MTLFTLCSQGSCQKIHIPLPLRHTWCTFQKFLRCTISVSGTGYIKKGKIYWIIAEESDIWARKEDVLQYTGNRNSNDCCQAMNTNHNNQSIFCIYANVSEAWRGASKWKSGAINKTAACGHLLDKKVVTTHDLSSAESLGGGLGVVASGDWLRKQSS